MPELKGYDDDQTVTRSCQELVLPDKLVSGLTLTNGRLVGLTNLVRYGEAFLEERQDKVFLTFSIVVRNLTGQYAWTRRKLRLIV